MPYTVQLTTSASRDLEELFHYITRHDSLEQALYVLEKIEAIVNSLSENPERGVYPQELLSLGIREYRELFFKPYRLLYRVAGAKVYIYLIADGRRDMHSLLQRRLLEA